jgi:fibronectin type 3 domain-containing protein
MVTVDLVPAAPAGLVAQSERLAVSLAWTASGEADVTGYRVYRSLTSGGPYTLAGSPSGPAFEDTASEYLVPLYYVVSAVDGALQESPASAEVSVTPHACLSDRAGTACAQ